MDKNEKFVGSLWYIDKERLSGSFTLHGHISRVEVNPFKQTQFSVSGKNYFKIWEFDMANKIFEVNKEATKSFEMLQNENVVDHCWLNETNYLIVGTAENVIYIFFNSQLVKKFDFKYLPSELKAFKNVDHEEIEEEEESDANRQVDLDDFLKIKTHHYSISSIEATSRGFVIGLKNIGAICIYEIGKII